MDRSNQAAFREFGRILRASRARSGTASMQSRVPAWLTLIKDVVKCGTSEVSWWRYESGRTLPNAICLIAIADMYSAQRDAGGQTSDDRARRLEFLAVLGHALIKDGCRLGAGSEPPPALTRAPGGSRVQGHDLVVGVRAPDCNRSLFPRFGLLLRASRDTIGSSLEQLRDRFPAWLELALRSANGAQREDCLCPSTLWRYERGRTVPNALVFVLMADVYGVSLFDLVTALEADIADRLAGLAAAPSGDVRGARNV
jgi:transcriptional regulator with XRE-family HTH domain